jgi:hypothetical protein
MASNPTSMVPRLAGMSAGIVVLFLGVVTAVSATGYAAWICNYASYSCPAHGCGDIPANNCITGEDMMLGSMLLAGPMMAIGAALVLAPKPR